MAKDANDSGRLSIRTTPEVIAYLDELARIGVHGKTKSEVAKTFISNEIERMLREQFLTLKKN